MAITGGQGIYPTLLSSFFSKKVLEPAGNCASWRKKVEFPAGIVRPDEKMLNPQRELCVLTRKSRIPSGDRASWRKNALSPSPESASRRKNAPSGFPKVRPDEKTLHRDSRKCVLAKKRIVGKPERTFWRKNAVSGNQHQGRISRSLTMTSIRRSKISAGISSKSWKWKQMPILGTRRVASRRS